MTSRLIDRLRSPRPWLVLGLAAIGTVLAAAGCTSLEEKEREIVLSHRARRRALVRRTAGGAAGDRPAGRAAVEGAEGDREAVGPRLVVAGGPQGRAGDPLPARLALEPDRQLFRIRELHDLGFSVFAIDYRGFGKSEGDLPSEKAVYEDARTGWNALAERVPDASRRFIYGHSLGGAIAVDLASSLSKEAAKGDATVPAAGLVVESSFTTLADIARSLSYSWLPIQLLLSQKFDAVDKIADVRMPVIVLHGERDRYVPVDLGRKLFDAAPAPKRLVVVEDGTHNNSLRLGERDMRRAFGDVFALRVPAS